MRNQPASLVFYKYAFIFIGCNWMLSSLADSRLNKPKLAFGIHSLSSSVFSIITYKGAIETERYLRSLYGFISSKRRSAHELATMPRNFILDESLRRLRTSQTITSLHFILQNACALMSWSKDESYFRSNQAATTNIILILTTLFSFLLLYMSILESEALSKTASRINRAATPPSAPAEEDDAHTPAVTATPT